MATMDTGRVIWESSSRFFSSIQLAARFLATSAKDGRRRDGGSESSLRCRRRPRVDESRLSDVWRDRGRDELSLRWLEDSV